MFKKNINKAFAKFGILLMLLSALTGCTTIKNSTAVTAPINSPTPAASPVAPSPSPVPSIFTVVNETSYPIAPGIKYTKLNLTGKGILDGKELIESVGIMEADAANPQVRFEPVSALGRVYGREAASKQAMRVDKEGYRAVGAFNMDFFDVKTFLGVPRGIQITNGEIITAPLTTVNALLIKNGGKVDIQNNINMNSEITAIDTGAANKLDAINRPRSYNDLKLTNVKNPLVLYTEKFGEKTASDENGVEAVIVPDKGYGKLQAGKLVTGIVESVVETNNSDIPKGKLVISAGGNKADWLKTNLKEGSKVSFKINFDKGVNEYDQVVSSDNIGTALPLLDNGELTKQAKDTNLAQNRERHPRTMVAVKQGKVYIISVDGRQPGHSDGITLHEAANYLKSLGMEKAYNADGGGSTACVVRMPGSNAPAVQNRPSDGNERLVGNTLVVISTAPEK